MKQSVLDQEINASFAFFMDYQEESESPSTWPVEVLTEAFLMGAEEQ